MEEPGESVALQPVSPISDSSTAARDVDTTTASPPYSRPDEGDPGVASSNTPPPYTAPSPRDGHLSLPPSTKLHRSSWNFTLLLLVYATFAILGWVATCILTSRPMNPHSNDHHSYTHYQSFRNYGSSDETWYRASTVLRAICAVVTIPVASAVCMSAAAVFVQRNGNKSRFTMRQVMALADRGWADPAVCGKALAGWKRYGTTFLALAMVLNILGVIIYPLQEGLLSSIMIKTPTEIKEIPRLVDISDLIRDTSSFVNLDVLLIRQALKTSRGVDNLWPALPGDDNPNPFVAQIPSGFNTGLLQQFVPRINSTAKYEEITEAEFPTGCDDAPSSAFYVQYSNMTPTDDGCAWNMKGCMPGNMRQTPWKSTRNRQDFSEELYLQFSLLKSSTGRGCGAFYSYTGGTYRLAISTTAGYFELPNYMNNHTSGPLLDSDPFVSCDGYQCQYTGLSHLGKRRRAKREDVIFDNTNSASLATVANKGPLLNLALALFGDRSLLSDLLELPEAAMGGSVTDQNSKVCMDQFPMGGLINGNGADIASCITHADAASYNRDLEALAIKWISLFGGNAVDLSNAFTSAALISHQIWLDNSATIQPKLSVRYDLGNDAIIPSISTGAIIGVSIVMGLFLLILFALAFYSQTTPGWTDRLDAFTMLRIGSAMHDELPLLVGRKTDWIAALDKMPGWVGDATEDGEYVHRLEVGAPAAIDGTARYACYEGNKEALDELERADFQKNHCI